MSLQEYRAFIASRAPERQMHGFDPRVMPEIIKNHQRAVLDFALRRGKSAAFLDTGLGKSLIELEFARQCAEETGKPSLILTPLAVAGQMVREGKKFGIGSTGYQAVKMMRRYLGFELKPEYAKVAGRNMADAERSCADLFSA